MQWKIFGNGSVSRERKRESEEIVAPERVEILNVRIYLGTFP